MVPKRASYRANVNQALWGRQAHHRLFAGQLAIRAMNDRAACMRRQVMQARRQAAAPSDREVIGAGDGQNHAQNNRANYTTNHQNGNRFQQDQHTLHAVAASLFIQLGQ